MSPKFFWRFMLPLVSILIGALALLAGYSDRLSCRTVAGCAWGGFALIGFAALGLMLLVGYFVGKREAQPILQMADSVEQLARGEQVERLLTAPSEPVDKLVVAVNELTDRWRVERESLIEGQQQLATVLNQIATGVLITNENGDVQLANPAALKLLGLAKGYDIHRSFAAVARHHQLIELWRRCREEGSEQAAVIEMGQGNSLFLQAIVTQFEERSENKCLVILQDLTRVRRLETVRRDLVSNVSHEFRTPLASLRAVVETLQDGALEDPPVAHHFLQRASVEVDALTQIVEELLTLSRIESGQVALRLKPTSASDLLLATAERFLPQAEREGIELHIDIETGLPTVLADEGQVLTVLSNLVHNAIKFTPAGGHITLAANQAYQQIRFQVTDTGEGIPAEDLPRIFERFYKADRARQRQVGGTGLGLAIAKHTVAAHGGQIWAESQERLGSTFYFTLPIAE